MTDVVRWLYDRYYAHDPGQLARAQMSSHWRLFSGRFDVSVSENGAIRTLSGYGFGDLEARGWAHSIIHGMGLAVRNALQPGRKSRGPILKRAWKVLTRMGLPVTQDVFRQVCTLDLLTRHLGSSQVLRILLIGDGYGVLAALLKETYPSARIALVDIGPTLLFQAVYLERAFPDKVHRRIDSMGAEDQWGFDFLYCPAEHLEKIPLGPLDLAVNIASFQEMTADSVATYFNFLRRRGTTLFYCCNRERKELPGGEVQEFLKYPWEPSDQHLVSGPCPWHQWFFGIARRAQHPRVLGLPVPFVCYYHGTHLHRLSQLARIE